MAITQASSAAPVARPKKPVTLQDWLETRGAVLAFTIAALSMMLRGAQFYSGGAFVLSHLLGGAGNMLFNVLTGFGLAVGCELVGSIAGRDWIYNQAEALEVEEQRGLSKAQRAARKKVYNAAAFRAMIFMYFGFGMSFAAALYFSITTTGAHTILAYILEAVIACALEGVVVYLGVFKASHTDASKSLEALGNDLLEQVLRDAGARISSGIHTMQDIRLFAGSFRDKRIAARFESAYVDTSANDPVWTTKDIMRWLGDDGSTEALRKRVNRRLAALQAAHEPVRKDPRTGAWLIAKSDVGRLFMDDFTALVAPALKPKPTHTMPPSPLVVSAGQDTPTPEPDRAALEPAPQTQVLPVDVPPPTLEPSDSVPGIAPVALEA